MFRTGAFSLTRLALVSQHHAKTHTQPQTQKAPTTAQVRIEIKEITLRTAAVAEPYLTAAEVQKRLDALDAVTSITMKEITPPVVKNLCSIVYSYAYFSLSPADLNWISWAIFQGQNHMTSADVTKLAFAFSHFKMVKEVGALVPQVMRYAYNFTSKRSSHVLMSFAECGLLTTYPDIVKQLTPTARYDGDQIRKLCILFRGHRGLYSCLIPIMVNAKGSTSLVACAYAYSYLDFATKDKNSEMLLAALSQILSKHMKALPETTSTGVDEIIKQDILKALLIMTESERPITVNPITMLQRMALQIGAYGSASPELLTDLISVFVIREMYENAAVVIAAVAKGVVPQLRIADTLIRTMIAETPKALKLNIIPIVKRLFTELGGVESLHVSVPPIISLLLLTEVEHAFVSEMITTLCAKGHSHMSPLERFEFAHEILMSETPLPLAMQTTLLQMREAMLREVDFNVESISSMFKIVKYALETSNADTIAVIVAAVAREDRKESDVLSFFHKLTTLPDSPLLRDLHVQMYKAVSFPTLVQVMYMSVNGPNYYTEYAAILRERIPEADAATALYLVKDRHLNHVPDYESFVVLVDVLTKHGLDWRTFLEISLGFGRRERLEVQWFMEHAHLISEFDHTSSYDATHMFFLLSRTNRSTALHGLTLLKPRLMSWITNREITLDLLMLLFRTIIIVNWVDQEFFTHVVGSFETQLNVEMNAAIVMVAIVIGKVEDKYTFLKETLLEKLSELTWNTVLQALQTCRAMPLPILVAIATRLTELPYVTISTAQYLSILWNSTGHPVSKGYHQAVTRALMTDVSPESWKTKEFSALIQNVLKLNASGDDIREAALSRFYKMRIPPEELGALMFLLSKLEVDLSRHVRKISHILTNNASNLNGTHIGMVFAAFTRTTDEVPRQIVDLLQPRMETLIPTLNATEFVTFAFPLLRSDVLPLAIGSLIVQGIRDKINSFNAQQAARMCIAVHKPYCKDESLKNDLLKTIAKNAERMRFQELIGLLGNPSLLNDQAVNQQLIQALQNRLTVLLESSSPMDKNWAMMQLMRGGSSSSLSLVLTSVEKQVEVLNGYEVSMILTSLSHCGLLGNTALKTKLVERIRQLLNGKDMKSSYVVSLLTNLTKHEGDNGALLTSVVDLLIAAPDLTFHLFMGGLEAVCKGKGKPGLVCDGIVLKGLEMARTSDPLVVALPILATCTYDGGLNTVHMNEVNELLTEIIRDRLSVSDIGSTLTKWPHLLSHFSSQLQTHCHAMSPQDIASSLNAFSSNDEFKDDATRDALFVALEKAAAGESRPLLPGRFAVMALRGHTTSTTVNATLAKALVESIESCDMSTVPPSLCLDTLSVLTKFDDPEPFNTVIPKFVSRVMDALESLSLPRLAEFQSLCKELDVDDDVAVVRICNRVMELKDMLLVYPHTIPMFLENMDHFGPNLHVKMYGTMIRLYSIKKMF
eukprot:PhF_6_TR10589/c0_g1_i1/m.16962